MDHDKELMISIEIIAFETFHKKGTYLLKLEESVKCIKPSTVDVSSIFKI